MAVAGTPLYMAPEQWKQETTGVYTDSYAFGFILYEMFTGYYAVEGSNIRQLKKNHCAGNLQSLPRSLPKELAAIMPLLRIRLSTISFAAAVCRITAPPSALIIPSLIMVCLSASSSTASDSRPSPYRSSVAVVPAAFGTVTARGRRNGGALQPAGALNYAPLVFSLNSIIFEVAVGRASRSEGDR